MPATTTRRPKVPIQEPPPLPTASSEDRNPFARPTHSLQINLDGMPLDQLLELRLEIDKRIPVRGLRDLDLNRELVLQVLALQQLQADVINDDDTPANQRAQVANSLSSALANLVRVQGDVYTTERLKKLEALYVDALNLLPEEVKHTTIEAYTRLLEESGQ